MWKAQFCGMLRLLSDHGVPYELHVYPSGRHGNAAVDDQTCAAPLSAEDARGSEWVEEAKRWLRFSLLK